MPELTSFNKLQVELAKIEILAPVVSYPYTNAWVINIDEM
jgi:hypothetical protein